MLALVEVIAKSLVENPDQVEVKETSNDGSAMTIELKVAPSDMGKVIGKQGRIAKALRTIMRAGAAKKDLKVSVSID